MKDWKLRKQLLFGLLLSLPLTVSPLEADSSSGTSSLPLNGCAIEISRYNGPDTSRDGLRLTNFTVAGPLEPVPTTGEIEVRFGLRNDGDQAFHIGRYGIFAGARDPAGDNRDFGHWLMNQTLNPGDTVSFWAKLEVEQPGDWTFWPAYSTSAGGWGPYEWHAAEVSVFEYEIKVSGLSEGQGLHAIDAPAFRLGDAGEWSSRQNIIEALDQELEVYDVGEVIDDANRDGHRAYPWLFSWLVENFHVGFVWNRGDRGVDYWFPQGITGTADAYDSGQLGGRKIVLVSWYYKEGVSSIDKGVRVSFAEVTDISDVDYRHSLLVDPYWRDGYPDFKAVPIHAGGIVWYDPYLYVADTHGGLRVFDMNHIFKVATDSDRIGRSSTGQYHAYRYKYVIPQIGTYRACTNNMKFSFVSLDRSSSPHSLISGEYEKKSIQGKLLRWPLDEMTSRLEESPSGDIRPTEAYVSSRRRMQGALAWEDEYWLSCSSQRELIPGLPFRVGSLYRTGVGTPSEECIWIDGPEDLHYAPQSGNLWSLTEHIGKRLVFALKPENCPSFLW